MKNKVRCDNCEWKGLGEKCTPMSETPRLAERLDPGSEVPAGTCPKCGAFVYLDRPDLKDAATKAVAAMGSRIIHGSPTKNEVGAFRLLRDALGIKKKERTCPCRVCAS